MFYMCLSVVSLKERFELVLYGRSHTTALATAIVP
jgi:hypothetical protein